jgi:hypothetical protein
MRHLDSTGAAAKLGLPPLPSHPPLWIREPQFGHPILALAILSDDLKSDS